MSGGLLYSSYANISNLSAAPLLADWNTCTYRGYAKTGLVVHICRCVSLRMFVDSHIVVIRGVTRHADNYAYGYNPLVATQMQ